jgi:membrane protease YdiL (CAAX protease family)
MRTIESDQPRGGRSLLALIRRHPLVVYFVIAYAFTWTFDLVFLVWLNIPDIGPNRSALRDLGPSIAALIVTAAVAGRTGLGQFFRRFLIWRVNVVWYLFAILGVPAIYIAGILLVPGAAASFRAPSLGNVAMYPVILLVIVVFSGPLFEEPGWRGFALPRMQERWSPLAAAVLLGVLWAGWHATEYLTPEFSRTNGGLTLSGVSIFLVGAICFSIMIAWVFNNTRASILMAILMHGTINSSQLITSQMFPVAGTNEVGPVVAFVVAALAIVVGTRGRLGYRTPSPAAEPRTAPA